MRRTLTRTLIGFAIAIAIVLALGGLFKAYTDAQFSAEQQDDVLVKAIPFVAVFVSIVLTFICLIALAAITLNGKIPQRAYRPIELIIIAGILIGVVGLFQWWKLFAYQFGFLLLLASVLAFMVWSHITPMTPRASRRLPPLSRRAHAIGIAAGLIVWLLVAGAAAMSSEPQEPYGFGQTLWDFKDEAEQEQIAEEAEDEYQAAKLPAVFLLSLLPAALSYFAAREIAASYDSGTPASEAPSRPPQRAGASPG
jgi:hypothetical protein